MDLSASSIIAGLVFSITGFYFYRQGKIRSNYWWYGVGIGQMVYGFFVTGPLATWGVGIALLGVAIWKR